MYVLIENNAVVNIIVADRRGADSLIASGINLVETEKPVSIGDTCTDGKFYRDGAEVLTELERLQAENEELLNLVGAAVEAAYQADLEAVANA